MTWRERPGAPPLEDVIGFLEQRLHEELERLGDDDGHRRRDLPHILVRLHYLLYPGLRGVRMR